MLPFAAVPSVRRYVPAAVAAAATLAIAAPATAVAGGCANADANPNHVSASVAQRATLCLLNAERRAHHLRRLRENGRLDLASVRHAEDMARNNYFAHGNFVGSAISGSAGSGSTGGAAPRNTRTDSTSDGGCTTFSVGRIRSAHYLQGARGWTVGENIAWGSLDWATPRAIMRSWMNSPPHRANILNRSFRDIGIGVARGAPVSGVSNAATYVTDFGARG